MSITFTADTSDISRSFVEEPCLCAQMSEHFCAAVDGDLSAPVRASLQESAWKGCPQCAGIGVELVPSSNRLAFNLSNDNACRLLAALGLPAEPGGEVSLPEARRAVLRARNVSLAPYARQEQKEHGRPREREDGTVELRPVRYLSPALTEGDLFSRVESFACLVDAATERGATVISWG